MTSAASAHTYIAGEDEGRLANAAQTLGLQPAQGRMPRKSWATMVFQDDTLTAARMHSVGFVGPDERVDEYGTLHLLSLQRTKSWRSQPPQHPQLTDLFAVPNTTTTSLPTVLDSVENGEQEEEEEEEVIIDMVEGGSLGAAAFGIVKGTVGPAILYLPSGFYKSGWLVGIPAMVFATFMFIFNAYRLLECWKVESERNHQVETRLKEVQSLLLYGTNSRPNSQQHMQQYGATTVQQDHLFTAKLLTYPELAKRALGSYSILVETGIALFQFGVCLTYLIFVPNNLYQCSKAILGNEGSITKLHFLWLMIAVEIPLSWIRDIRKLTITNVLATFLILFGLGSVFTIALSQGTQTSINPDTNQEEMVFVQNLRSLRPLTDSWFLFIGTSFFMMEGSITLLVPLQEAVYREEDRTKFPDMNRDVTSWIVVFYIVFSLIACAAFGSTIQTALTASLTGRLATAVQLAYSIAVILTFPLQAFPAMEVAIRMLNRATATTGAAADPNDAAAGGSWRRNAFATAIIVSLGIVAVVTIDYLGNVVSILGSMFGIPLALVFPPLMHNSLVKDSSRATRMTNYGVVAVGFFAMAAASFNTLATWDRGAEG